MASLIAENHYLIPKKLRETYAERNKYLLIATNLEKVNEYRDPVEVEFEKMHGIIEQLKEDITSIKGNQ